jgi:YihY family inner membrane protein
MMVLPKDTLYEGITIALVAAPGQLRAMLSEHLNRFVEASNGGFALLGALLAIWGASRGALALGRALNTMHGVKETRGFLRQQLTAILVTLACAVLVIVALGLLVAGPFVGHLIADRFGLGSAFDTAWTIGRWIGAALLVMLVWAILLFFLPNLKRPFRWVTPGAIVGTLIWLGISQLFALYVQNFGKYEATYGALGAVIIGLTWLWMTNFALLLGGEIDDALDDIRREKHGQPKVGKENEIVERERREPQEDAMVKRGNGHDRPPAGHQAAGTELAAGDLGGLARRIGDDLSTLAKDHIELAKIETTRSLKAGAIDVVALLLGAIVALIGFGMLCATAVVALEPLVEPLWLRMLIMSLVYLLVGGGLAAAFANKLRHDVPPDLRKVKMEARLTANAMKGQVQHG